MTNRNSFLLLYSLLSSLLFYFIPTPLFADTDSIQNKTIPPVVVDAKEKYQFLARSITSGPKTLITHQQIKEAGLTSLPQTLQSLANIKLTSITGVDSQMLINIRGFGANGSSNALFLVDGSPITNPDLAPPDLNMVPIDEIESVEVVTGSESVLYGDMAVSGIINVITRNKMNEKPTLTCDTGSYQQYGCRGRISHYYHPLNLTSTLTLMSHHSNNYRAHNDYDQDRLLGRFDFSAPTHQLNFSYQVAYENMQYPGALTGAEVKANRRAASNDTDFFKDWNGSFNVAYQQFLSSHLKLKVDGAYRKMNGAGVLFSSFSQSRSSYFLRPQIQGVIFNNLMTSGIDLQFDQYHLGSGFGLTDEKESKLGLFALTTVPLKPNLIFSIGGRASEENSQLKTSEIFSHRNRAIATTLGLTYHPPFISHTNLYVRRAASFRFPKADENAFTADPRRGLQTEHGISYETGIEINRINYALKLNGYLLNLTDEIAFDPTKSEANPFGINRNLAKTERLGFNVAIRYQVMQHLSVDSQYDFVDARFKSGANLDNRIPLVPAHIFHANLHYQIGPHLHFYTGTTYTGNQYTANDDQNIAGRIGGYFLYHLNIRYDYKPFFASLRINNIFNKYYYFYTVLQQSTQFFYPAPGRNFVLKINYEMC
jgi:iron complex outermembrane receptor protein